MIGHNLSPLEASVLVLNKMFAAGTSSRCCRHSSCCARMGPRSSTWKTQFATYNFDTQARGERIFAEHFREEDDDWVRNFNTTA